MAWVTIRVVDNHGVSAASANERRWLWQRGDIVDVTDVHPGRKVTASPRMLAIEFPGKTAADLRHLTEGMEIGRRLRRWRIDAAMAAMPQTVRRRLLDAVRDRKDIELTGAQQGWILDYLEARV